LVDLQYLYGLARAGRAEADVLHVNMQRHAEQDPVWRAVALPAAAGLLAHARSDHAQTVTQLVLDLPRLREISGSHAQRDLFQQIHVDTLVRSGQWVEAQHLLQQQVRGQAESTRLAWQAAQVKRSLGSIDIGRRATERCA
jgi:hypothetical protein